jgi:nitrate/nitrite transport system ATP-binding protein
MGVTAMRINRSEAGRPALQPAVMEPVPHAGSAPALLELRGVAKSYGHTPILSDINLNIHAGEFIAIVGFSGTGKTTLISLIAGLIKPDHGWILKSGQPVTGPGPDRGVVFQSYSLMPWMTVYENVALAVDRIHAADSRTARRARVEHYVAMVNLTAALHKRHAELSGGMRQRVAVARALAMQPDILLLDEPLSALDALTRASLQDEICNIWSEERTTVVMITNDVDEALLLADRVIPLKPGRGATLGPEFSVELPRPRDRTALNHDPDFKRLRKDITQYLIDAGMHRAEGPAREISLPAVQPSTAHEMQPPGAAHHPVLDPSEADRYVDFARVAKIYPTRDGPVKVVEDFNLHVRKGEFITLIGHSGCGKSTVLSMVAGLNAISEGGIVLDYREVADAGPDRGIVFQAPSLVPWLTAYQNVALGVERVFGHATRAERRAIVEYYLTRVGLAGAMHRRASELSSGMKQRVGIARAFALAPKLLLLDEPFGMLDSLTRWELQEVLMEVWARTRLTAIMVTHDVDEAILLADRVVMMTNGPRARVGRILPIELPRPRTRKQLLEHADYYRLREELIQFLASCDHVH